MDAAQNMGDLSFSCASRTSRMAEISMGHNILDYEWPCPSCTFINKPGSFKCHMCETPKGTATRQVKSSVSALEMQYATETAIKAHNSRLKAAAAAAAAPTAIQINSSFSTITAATTTTLNTSTVCSGSSMSSSANNSSQSSPCYQWTESLAPTGQKRRQKSKTSSINLQNSSISPTNQSKNSQSTKLPKSISNKRRVKTTCNITIDGVTVTITEIDTIYSGH